MHWSTCCMYVKSTPTNSANEFYTKTLILSIFIISFNFFQLLESSPKNSRQHEGLDDHQPATDDSKNNIKRRDCFTREIYLCDINECGLEFTTKQAINSHLQKHHNIVSAVSEKKYVCETCGAILKQARALQEHQLLHVDKSLWPFKCNIEGCSKTFRNVDRIKEHTNRHYGIKPYVCPHCNKRFCSPSNLSAHVNFHTLEKKWCCNFCPKVVYTAAALRQHIQKDHENNPEATRSIPCRFCDKRLSSYTARKNHEMKHTGEKPYVCEICSRAFIQPSALKAHMRTHEVGDTKKKINCLHCHRSFTTAVGLRRHVLKHAGEKPYECGDCGVKFRYKSNLRRHHRQNLCRKPKNRPDKDEVMEELA